MCFRIPRERLLFYILSTYMAIPSSRKLTLLAVPSQEKKADGFNKELRPDLESLIFTPVSMSMMQFGDSSGRCHSFRHDVHRFRVLSLHI